jgi:hypothetical protein
MEEWKLDMGSGADNFTYKYLRRLLETAKASFEVYPLREAPGVLPSGGRPKLFLRHDVDISLEKAGIMAEIEQELGLTATYMVLLNAPLYSLEDKASYDILQKILEMGHEVGLHFDLDDKERQDIYSPGVIDERISSAKKHLTRITGQPVRSISFHRPIDAWLRGPFLIQGMVNAYSRKLMSGYLSDSRGVWRAGDPIPQLARAEASRLQLLIHPIWWGEEHLLPEDRLQEFFDLSTRGRDPHFIREFDEALAHTIRKVQRRFFRR